MRLVRRGATHLTPATPDDVVLRVFGVGLDFNLLAAAGRPHGEAPDLGAVVGADLLLLGVEADALADEVVAAGAPDVERHLEADDQNALVQLLRTLPQRVLPSKLQATNSMSDH